ncbi:LADA_0B07646g1_1 [Lachancea dasiensis]|uniref:LADA_0B07646g1_1 n=1 Tax=Lachancea dasiensis TaxID=1072105 RepID=A0A1G4IUM9_9SACH|nr:LADA_0B07646g1_1 [Lachancea dasiensis]
MSMRTQANPLATYNVLLQRRPLLTKIATGAVLSALSELISQFTTPSVQTLGENDDGRPKSSLQKVKSLLQKPKYCKLLVMLLYGGLVNAPINHYFYGWITQFTNRSVAPRWKRLAQLCGSWFVVSPIQVLGLITALTLVNSPEQQMSHKLTAVAASLRARYGPMLTSSVISSTAFVSIAQQYISPEKWSVFFSLAYAVLNTGQNIYMKISSEPEQQSK